MSDSTNRSRTMPLVCESPEAPVGHVREPKIFIVGNAGELGKIAQGRAALRSIRFDRYAEICRVQRVMQPYLEALVA